MRQQRPLVLSIPVVLALLLLPGSICAQDNHRFSIGLMAGFGGTTDSAPATLTGSDTFLSEDNFDLGFQLLFNMEVERGVLFGVRLGQMGVELEGAAVLPGPVESELTYLTLAGEYRLPAGLYQSGLYVGLGYYAIEGKNVADNDTALGLNLGVTGDFRLADRWSLLIELSGHYADLNYAQFFIMGHAGLAFHF